MMISPELLRRYPFFANVSAETLGQVAMISEEKMLKAGTKIFDVGDEADKLYIIEQGEVEIQYPLGSGELRTVDTAIAGELIMWSALVPPFKSTAVAVVHHDARLIVVDGKRLRELTKSDSSLGYHLLLGINQLLASRLDGTRVQLSTAV
jgi:CRP-like cAMP-binding protein